MIEVIRKKHGISIKEVYFYPKSELKLDLEDTDILFLIQSSEDFGNSTRFNTSIINLNEDESSLFSHIKKNTKYEINRAQNKDNWKIEIINSPNTEQLLELKQKFDTFAQEKKIGHFNLEKLHQLNGKGGLVISLGKYENEVLLMHVYVSDGQRARLLYSSNFNQENEVDRSIIGRGNRMLHWEDIKWFKQHGFCYYDFGGLGTQTEKEKNIAQFKKDFGGQDIVEWNLIRGTSLKGKVALSLFNRIKNM